MYDARLISNFVLVNYDANKYSISNKKLNKLLYILNGASLGGAGCRLISNPLEAWRHGPVYRVVYDEFKSYGARPIEGLALAFDFRVGRLSIADPSEVSVRHQKWIATILSRFIEVPANELERESHVRNGPWWKTYYGANCDPLGRISDSDIASHFSKMDWVTRIPLAH